MEYLDFRFLHSLYDESIIMGQIKQAATFSGEVSSLKVSLPQIESI